MFITHVSGCSLASTSRSWCTTSDKTSVPLGLNRVSYRVAARHRAGLGCSRQGGTSRTRSRYTAGMWMRMHGRETLGNHGFRRGRHHVSHRENPVCMAGDVKDRFPRAASRRGPASWRCERAGATEHQGPAQWCHLRKGQKIPPPDREGVVVVPTLEGRRREVGPSWHPRCSTGNSHTFSIVAAVEGVEAGA